MELRHQLERQRQYFQSGQTKSYAHRMAALNKIEAWIHKHEAMIQDALYQDLRKAPSEAYMSEIGMTLSELRFQMKHLRKWMKPVSVPMPLAHFYSRGFYDHEPYGVVLIMAPWNYPFLLCMEPLIGAIAAGNCVVLKPSAYAPHTSSLLAKMIEALFDPAFITCIEGGREANTQLLEERFDYIFFTGSVAVAKTVMEKASRHLTPVTLELGGKSPCIVERSAHLKSAAKRIVFGKFLNSGQTCVAPDYLLVDETIQAALVKEIITQIKLAFPSDPLQDPHLPKIINAKHMRRLCALLNDQSLLYGGRFDEEKQLIEPTLVELNDINNVLMQEEIFGPILPILTYQSLPEAIQLIKKQEKPLALYLFTRDRKAVKKVLSACSFGGGCINDTIIQLSTSRLGFGGVGNSGMGSYHGYESFRTFSHRRSIVKKAIRADVPVRFRPYSKAKDQIIRRFLK